MAAGVAFVLMVLAAGLGVSGSAYASQPIQPVVQEVAPSAGQSSGGTLVRITGSDFNKAETVWFGSVAATQIGTVSSTKILATAPAQAAGTVDVTVSYAGTSSAVSDGDRFTYGDEAAPAPTVQSVGPSMSPTAGGTTVRITGSNFELGSTVRFGAVPARVKAVYPTRIDAVIPAGSAGTVDVTVSDPDGTSSISAADRFFYFGPPTVGAVSPRSGPTGGGTSVTITGTGFGTGTSVSFGSVPAASMMVVSSRKIVAQSPPTRLVDHAGPVDITVERRQLESTTSPDDQFTYVRPPLAAPVVTAISPSSGPISGGTSVLISGQNFEVGTTVRFGAETGVNVYLVSDTEIYATAPAQTVGTVDVTVIDADGTSSTTGADQFTYTAPIVSGVAPDSGSTAGGTPVTITGSDFSSDATVAFGPDQAADVTIVSPTELMAVAPPDGAGTVNVRVTDGKINSPTSSADQFTYVAPPRIKSVSPSSGPTSGGTAVTITGSNFASGATIQFGGVVGTDVTVVSPTEITVTAPAQTASGTVDVTVSDGELTSPIDSADQFTYQDSTVPS